MPPASAASTLTPVRIRGRKRQHAIPSISKAPVATSRRFTASKEAPAPRASKPPTQHLSSLELLPKEILEIVFTYTVNPSLPRASPVLARKLSGQRLFDWHCRRIFRTFEYELEARKPKRYVVFDGCIQDDWDDLRKARTCTLQHSRMTYDYFVELLRGLVEEEKDRLLVQYHAASKTKKRVPLTEHNGLRIWHVSPLENVKSISDLARLHRALKISFECFCNIPGSLLRFPLSTDSRKLLDFLVHNGAQVDWRNSFDPERAHRAWNLAVRARNYRLVHRLMGPGINVRPSEEDLHECLEALDWDASMFKLIAISFNISKAYYSPVTIPRRLPWPIEGYGGHEELGIVGMKAFFDTEYPNVWMKALARNPPGSIGREILEEYSNKLMIHIWGGAMCSAGILKDSSRLCYCIDSLGHRPNIGAWHSC